MLADMASTVRPAIDEYLEQLVQAQRARPSTARRP